MKKTFRFMAVLATVAAALVSCAKAEMDAPANEDASGENVYQGPTKLLTFEAQAGTPQTRTSLGDVVNDGDGKTQPVLWEEGDEIKILYIVEGTEYSVKVTPKSVNGSTAVFEAKVPETGVDTYYAVYPSSATSTLTMTEEESGELKVGIATTTGTFKKANIMVAKCAASVPQLNFKHACSIVKFTTGDVAPGEVFFYSGDRTYIRGYNYVNFDSANAIASIATVESSNKYSSVVADKPNTDYYMAIWPDYTLNDGFMVAFRSSSFTGTKDGWRVAYYPQDITLGRGEILNLGVIQNKIRTDYFVAKEAKGKMDGSSWDNACDIAYVRNMFAKPADADYAYAQQMKLENTNFWFAGGVTFVFGTEEAPRLDMCFAAANKSNRCPINFYGGCTGTTGTDKTRDPKNHPTVFSGIEKYAIFSVRNKTTLTLDGITLADARAVAANTYDKLYGAALYVGFLAEADGIYKNNLDFSVYAPQVHVNNCKFVNNVEDVTSSLSNDFGGGVALNLNSGKLYVNNCEFTGNVSHNRGPVRVGNSAADGSCMFLNSCTFTGNYAKGGYGRLVWAAAKTCKFGMNNCMVYSNDSETTPSTSAGVLALNSPYVLVNNTFVETTENAIASSKPADHGIIRTYVNGTAYSGTIGVLGNNIIVETSSNSDSDVKRNSVYTYVSTGYSLTTISYGNNVNTKTTYGTNSAHTASDKDKTGVLLSNLSKNGNYYYWTAGEDETYVYAVPSDMVAATKANTLIGDSFHDWLVEIGAIVNGQFTDCRGYLREADKMCPGAYDPFATAE